MSEGKVIEKNASSDRPNPFAINVGNLLTGSNPERAIGDAIEKLVVQPQRLGNK